MMESRRGSINSDLKFEAPSTFLLAFPITIDRKASLATGHRLLPTIPNRSGDVLYDGERTDNPPRLMEGRLGLGLA